MSVLFLIDIVTTPAEPWVEVLVDCPGLQSLFTYAIPAGLSVAPGDVLRVPLGSRTVGGIAIQARQQLPPEVNPEQVRPVTEVLSSQFFPAGYWALLSQLANYYQTPLIQVVRAALPPGLLRQAQRRIRLCALADADADALPPAARQLWDYLRQQPQGDYSWRHLQQKLPQAAAGLRVLLRQGWVESYWSQPDPPKPQFRQVATLVSSPEDKLTPQQQRVVDVLGHHGGVLEVTALKQAAQVSDAPLKRLATKGYLVIQAQETLRTGQNAGHRDQPKPLTPAQQRAVLAIQAAGRGPLLLHGVTGSGKTEVYLQALAPVLARGQAGLVLVPEIGLTPQLTDRFRARFGSQVLVYHSGLADGERYDTWRLALAGRPVVLIGTRSAVLVPLPNLGLIILDEEHDSSFKQEQPAPCYHARTVATWRAEEANCPLILGTATPSLETWEALRPTDRYLELPERIPPRPLPPVTVVDMRRELQVGNFSLFSRTLAEQLTSLPQQGHQAILFVPRRGFSSFVSCRSCGYVLGCPRCDTSLTYHQHSAGEGLHCHYCGWRQTQPDHCPQCESPYFKHFGCGTQRVVEALERHHPQLRVLRFDSDTTQTKDGHRKLLTAFAEGKADVLVGTQMLTKGLDLPRVTLVGILAADGLLHLGDYRAQERAFQLFVQVAGRAGRAEAPGHVILQTYTPDHPLLPYLLAYDYPGFMAQEAAGRQVLGYPPHGRLILLRLT
ncbi:MAG: primosomal protein N' [Gloeomargaritaceae cyanobacterium C42_A2020_066]|nr:primosomal protein N' [Gloeomargaritaceae cyanobacterium C42_A2020_066]